MPSKFRILIVDDYEPLRYLKARILSKANFAVSEAATGKQALVLVAAAKPDLVLLDLHLPDMYGTEVCRAIKRDFASLPVIYTTSGIGPRDADGVADGYLTGLEPEDLVQSVNEFLQSRPATRTPPAPVAIRVCQPTRFASASRAPFLEVEEQARSLASDTILVQVLDCHPYPSAVLNRHRQIVLANCALLKFVEAKEPRSVLGLRPGEVLKCVHAGESEGCGTTEFCQTCGAVQAILEAQLGLPNAKECRITRRTGPREEALDLAVSVSPLGAGGGLVLCSLMDISHQKRLEALQRIFFHDIMNSATALQVCAEELKRTVPQGDGSRSAELVCTCARELVSEIGAQQQLAAAESNDLAVTLSPVNVPELVSELVARLRSHPTARDVAIRIDGDCPRISMTSHRALLSRVLGNMLTNALEASPAGDTVTVGYRVEGDGVEFRVHNSAGMPREVQLEVFQRSFSTKGKGRGLGTYGMKLLSERYLGGRVWFESDRAGGTTFFARYPLRMS